MESVNQICIDALQFISVIQDVFAKKRLHVETLCLQEYDNYVKGRKKDQKIIIKPLPKESEPLQADKQPIKDQQISLEVQELALVDALLEKARNIRIKNKELLKGAKDDTNKPQSLSSTSKPSKLQLQHKVWIHKNTKESIEDKRITARSKSTLIASTVRTAVMPRSKSVNVHQVAKDTDKAAKDTDKVAKTDETVIKIRSAKNKSPKMRKEQKTNDKCGLAVLSNKDFKKLFSDHKDCDTKPNKKLLCIENSNIPSSDCFQFSNHHGCFPTYRKFQSDLKRLYLSKSCFKLHSSVVWYPYLSAKNKHFLFSVKQFDSFDSFKKSLEILHKIQETMVWIDILNFVEKALFKLQLLDTSDENVIQVCSYLSSICHKDLQRTPLLD